MPNKKKFKRILLKLSGEILAGGGQGIDPEVLDTIANEIVAVKNQGVQIGIVIGGGNIFRGLAGAAQGMDRVSADHMGMLATTINCLALQNVLETKNVPVRVLSAIRMDGVAEPFVKRNAVRYLNDGEIVVFAAGTGNPYFTTDTAAALRASEIDADVLLKGTKVDGVYSGDPEKNKDVTLFKELSFIDVIKKQLRVMDTTAVSLCMDNDIPIIVFNFRKQGNLLGIIAGTHTGTIVKGEGLA